MFYKENFDIYINKLKSGEHFKYSRFNDGEINAASGFRLNSSNCDGHEYFPNMGKELDSILRNYKYSDQYILEHYKYWYDNIGLVRKYLDGKLKENSDLRFLDDDFIRKMHENKPNRFIDLIESFKDKNIVIVGGEYLKELKRFFDFEHIVIPQYNCYLKKNEIIREIEMINNKNNNNIYLFSASMATNIIIHNFRDDEHNSYIDWGSVWDTFFIGEKYSFLKKRSSSNKDKYLKIYKDYLIE